MTAVAQLYRRDVPDLAGGPTDCGLLQVSGAVRRSAAIVGGQACLRSPVGGEVRAGCTARGVGQGGGADEFQGGVDALELVGSESTSSEFRSEIGKLDMRQSMGRVGSCYDNAAAESFFAVLKEEIGARVWPDGATARAEVFSFIETFYNRRRLRKHPEWGYLTPLETRQRHRQGHTLAA
ncbi:hypothetical protein GCM10010519_24160 [Streptomyces lactacystinicus]